MLILQKKVEANSSLLSTNCQSQEENSLRAQLLDYKERCEQLIMTICKKDKIVEDLEEKCLSLENRAATLAQENDSLRLALDIIIQEKSEGKYHHQKADQCWHQVENSRMKVGSADRCQRNATTNNIVTRNSFEPLGDDTQVDVRNEINCNTNREDKNSRRPSCSQKKRTSNRSGPMEPPSEPEKMQSIRRKEIIIAGDSILKNLQGHKMCKNSRVKVSSFPGCTTLDMKDHIKPLLRRNPDEIIIHVGTNNLRSCDTPRTCAEEIIDLATMASSKSSAEIALSSLVRRSDDEALACKISGVNKILEESCRQNSWGFVDHSNILGNYHLNRSGLHLNKSGTSRLARNFTNYLRLD